MMITIKIPPLLTWQICQIVVDYLFLVVTTCVLNQSRGHWLLSDAFHFAISMSLKLIKESENAPSFQTLMKRILLICMTFNIRKKVCGLFLFEEI